jgi:sugar phosphate isomerase/epimerase
MQPKFAFTANAPDVRGKGLAWSGEPERIFGSLKHIGYDGVEIFVRDPNELDAGKFRRMLGDCGLAVAAVGTGPVVAEDKLYLTHDDAALRRRAVARGKAVADFAAELGAQMNIGKFRGDVGGNPDKQAWMDEGVLSIAAHARTKNTFITIEPQNRFGCDNGNTTRQALAWLRALNAPNVKLMLDVFHMQIDDACIPASFMEAAAETIHVHFADTNRGCPGSGSIDFALVLRMLNAMRYDRFISMEIRQIPDSERAARQALAYVKMLGSFIWE